MALSCLLDARLAWGELVPVANRVVDPAALILGPGADYGRGINGQSYQASALLSHRGWQYAGYYDADRRVCIARRKLPDGAWEKLHFPDFRYPAENTHDTISLGISAGDGRIHLSYSQHGIPLRYRVSEAGVASDPDSVKWAASVFTAAGASIGRHRLAQLTYPLFLPAPDGGLLFCWRSGVSGAGENWFSRYDAASATWSEPWPITSREGMFQDDLGKSASRCAYFNDHRFAADGKLHLTFCWREKAPTANHDLAYMVSDDGGKTWRTCGGQTIDGPARVDTPGLTVVGIPRRLGLMNQCAQTVDAQGRVHVLVLQCTDDSLSNHAANAQLPWGPPEARRYIHWWRSLEGEWTQNELPGAAGSRPELIADREGNLFALALVPEGTGTRADGLYLDQGRLVIYAATAASAWTDWKLVEVVPGPFLTEPNVDLERWHTDGILDVLMQDSGANSSPLRVLTFDLAGGTRNPKASR